MIHNHVALPSFRDFYFNTTILHSLNDIEYLSKSDKRACAYCTEGNKRETKGGCKISRWYFYLNFFVAKISM